MKAKLLGAVVVLALAAFGLIELSGGSGGAGGATAEALPSTPDRTLPAPEAQAADGIRSIVDDVAIKNYGDVVYRGRVDLSATIERIRAGERHPHRNDGSVFSNRERLLPSQPRGYYREYVHPTENISGPGPQRLVVGNGGDWWYTPDHYASFVELGQEARR